MDALERAACYRGKSQKPVVSKRKNIGRIEVSGAHVLRAHIGAKIGLRLVSSVNTGIKRKPAREIMRKSQSDVSALVVLAHHIEILAETSDPLQIKLCPLSGAI